MNNSVLFVNANPCSPWMLILWWSDWSEYQRKLHGNIASGANDHWCVYTPEIKVEITGVCSKCGGGFLCLPSKQMAQLKVVSSSPKVPSPATAWSSMTRVNAAISRTVSAADITSAVTLRVFGEAANHSLHRLLQHGRVPRVTVTASPRPQPRSHSAVQAVELQRRRRGRRPGGRRQRGRRGQQRCDGDRNPGPERGAEGPGRSRTESDARL